MGTQTVTYPLAQDMVIDVRALAPANIGLYDVFGQEPPFGTLLSDVVTWYTEIKFDEPLPLRIWKSSEVPPRVRLGHWRTYLRGSQIESEYIVYPRMRTGQYSYFADRAYLDRTDIPGVYPPRPDNASAFYYGYTGYDGGDKQIIHLADPALTGTVTLYYVLLPGSAEEFF